MVPLGYKTLYSRDQISKRTKELGLEIGVWAAEVVKRTRREVLTVPLLSGGIFFYADLVRELEVSVDLSPIRVKAYLSNETQQSVQVAFDDIAVRGRTVLLIDDICDSGRTLRLVTQKMKDLGASEVKSAVLVKRDIPEAFEPDWSGFRYLGEEWLVGYGMDDNDRNRNLPDIYIIENR